MPLFDPTSEIPGYAEAIARQDFLRRAAFIGVNETICKIQVSPITFRHLEWLHIIKSPFIGAGEYNLKNPMLDVAAFLKTLAPLSRPSFMLLGKTDMKELKKFMQEAGKINLVNAVDEINETVTETWLDAPCGGDSNRENYYSVAAMISNRLCAKYGGLDPNPMNYPSACDIPLKVAFQMFKCLKRDENPKAILFNGLSDTAKTRWLESQNQKPEEN